MMTDNSGGLIQSGEIVPQYELAIPRTRLQRLSLANSLPFVRYAVGSKMEGRSDAFGTGRFLLFSRDEIKGVPPLSTCSVVEPIDQRRRQILRTNSTPASFRRVSSPKEAEASLTPGVISCSEYRSCCPLQR
jgi:hypothetical protein